MTQKEFRRLSRQDLVDIILELQKQEADLRQELEELKAKQQEKDLILENAGSIAEASLALNQVFASAQAAADQYTASVKARVWAEAKRILEDARLEARRIREGTGEN